MPFVDFVGRYSHFICQEFYLGLAPVLVLLKSPLEELSFVTFESVSPGSFLGGLDIEVSVIWADGHCLN